MCVPCARVAQHGGPRSVVAPNPVPRYATATHPPEHNLLVAISRVWDRCGFRVLCGLDPTGAAGWVVAHPTKQCCTPLSIDWPNTSWPAVDLPSYGMAGDRGQLWCPRPSSTTAIGLFSIHYGQWSVGVLCGGRAGVLCRVLYGRTVRAYCPSVPCGRVFNVFAVSRFVCPAGCPSSRRPRREERRLQDAATLGSRR